MITKKKTSLPLLITKGIYIFPGSSNNLTIGFSHSVATVSLSVDKYQNKILLVSQTETQTKSKKITKLDSFYKTGVICQVKITKKLPDGFIANFTSLKRIKITDSSYLKESSEKIILSEYQILEDKKLLKAEKTEISDYIFSILETIGQKLSPDFKNKFSELSSINEFINMVLQNYPDNKANFKQIALETDSLFTRYQLVKKHVKFEPLKSIDFSKLIEQSIDKRIKNRFSSQRREFYLRAKLKAIQEELGEINPKDSEVNHYFQKLNSEEFPEHVREKLNEEIKHYQNLPFASGEASLVKGYLDWIFSLPWTVASKENSNLNKAKKILNNNHFGLKKAKERIIEHLAANIFANKTAGQIICLVGPPGTGKTSLGISIAQALGKNYVRIALGGVKDESEIRGHRRTYIGSMPGKIVQAMKRAKTINPVILIDEIDKLASDFRGDPASAMLEVLDPEQNKEFVDHYIEVAYDLSKVIFIATANYEGNIHPALYDRMEVVNLSSYTELEKISIASCYLVPKSLQELGLTKKEVIIEETALREIIKYYTREAGVRELKRMLAKIMRKVIVKLLSNQDFKVTLTEKNVASFLGKRIFEYTNKSKKAEIGVVTGLAYTQFGGDILPIETTIFQGQGKLILTGKLGEVMKESANIAFDYIKANAQNFNINFDDFTKNDFHIHVPEGAIPKDGPSAGVTITTALISLLLKQKVSNLIAMTGEITLRGNILPIGGLKEKTISATRSGIKEVFIPKANAKDLIDLPSEVKKNLKIHLVSKYQDIYKAIFN